MITWIVLLILGLIAGTLSGLLGIGGGIILVPMLATIFPLISINSAVAVHLALGTALACSFITLVSSSTAHKRNGNVKQQLLYVLLPGLIIGAVLGPYLVHLLPGIVLRYFIGFILCALAINMAFDFSIPESRRLPSSLFMKFCGFIIALISSAAGLSGAVFIVPYLSWYGVAMRHAVGTAATCGLPLAFVGMIAYMVVGYKSPNLPDYALGYVYWPAVVVITLTSVPAAQLAAKFSLRMPKEILKRLLAVVLSFVAAKMLFF